MSTIDDVDRINNVEELYRLSEWTIVMSGETAAEALAFQRDGDLWFAAGTEVGVDRDSFLPAAFPMRVLWEPTA